jgi:predicted ATPase
LESESEKVTVAELNLKAASKAKSATAYAEGFAYVVQGLALLDTDSWQHHYDLTLAMYNEVAELSYLTGHYDRLDEIEGRIHMHAQSILDRARVYYIRTMIDTDQGRLLESIETGIGALAELGITIPREPSPEDIQRAEDAFTEALAIRSLEQLTHLPVMTDRGALAAMEIMAAVLLNAYIASPPHLSLLTYRGASLSLQEGNGPWSPFFFSVVVLLWAGEVDNSPTDASAKALEEAQKLAEILLKMLKNPKYARCKAKSLDAILGPLNWSGSMKQLLDLALEIYQTGLDTGDLVYAGLGVFHLANLGLASGMNLNEYIKTVSAYRQHVIELGQDYTYRMAGIGLQTAENLMTPCSEPDVLEEQHFDERQWLPDAVAANDGLTLFLVFQAKLLLSYHFDRDGRLIECAGEAEKYLESVHGMINIGFFRFYDSLSRLRLHSSLSADERELALKRVESNQLRMRIWAQSGPMTFQHKYDLVEAELARVSGNIGPAIELYERAIEGARDNEFIHEEALANELYAISGEQMPRSTTLRSAIRNGVRPQRFLPGYRVPQTALTGYRQPLPSPFPQFRWI